MSWHDLTKKKDIYNDKYKDKDNNKDKYVKRAPSKSNPRDLWPLRHLISVMRRPHLTKKRQWILQIQRQRQRQRQRQWQRQLHLKSTFKERFQRLVTFETFDQSGEETWPNQKKMKTKTNTKTMTETNTFREHHQRASLQTCDLWDILSGWGGDMTWPTKIRW